MSNGVIEDGTGKGFKLKITSANRARVESVEQSIEQRQNGSGNSFNIETPIIKLTTANESGVLYLKNTGSEDIVITGFFNLLGNSTGGAGDFFLFYRFNTDGGTLKSTTANVITPVNKNGGSSETFPGTVLFGAEGKTVDSGLKTISSLSTGTGRNTLLVEIVLPKSSSISVSIQPHVVYFGSQYGIVKVLRNLTNNITKNIWINFPVPRGNLFQSCGIDYKYR